MQGPHSHWEEYHVRIFKPKAILAKETLQCICIHDGVIFHEVEINSRDN